MKKKILVILLCIGLPFFANAKVLIQGSEDWGITGIDGIVFPLPLNYELLVMYEFPEMGNLSVAAGGGFAIVNYAGPLLPALSTDLAYKLFETKKKSVFSIHWKVTGGYFPFFNLPTDMYAGTALLASWHWTVPKIFVQVGPAFAIYRLNTFKDSPEYKYYKNFYLQTVIGIRL